MIFEALIQLPDVKMHLLGYKQTTIITTTKPLTFNLI